MENCLFCKIVRKEIPKEFVYEDSSVVGFDDINPVNETHILFIPKSHYDAFEKLDDDIVMSSVRRGIQKLVKERVLIGKGYKIVVNGGGAQVINHLHFHLIGPIGHDAKV